MLSYKLEQTAAALTAVVDHINVGGCCVVATIVGNIIESQVNDAKVLVLSTRNTTVESAGVNLECDYEGNYSVDELQANGLWVTHMLLEFELDGITTYFDTDLGVFEHYNAVYDQYGWDCDVVGEVSLQEATSWAAEPEAWNDAFDRDTIPMLEDVATALLAA